jgi:hypothetical protein
MSSLCNFVYASQSEGKNAPKRVDTHAQQATQGWQWKPSRARGMPIGLLIHHAENTVDGAWQGNDAINRWSYLLESVDVCHRWIPMTRSKFSTISPKRVAAGSIILSHLPSPDSDDKEKKEEKKKQRRACLACPLSCPG